MNIDSDQILALAETAAHIGHWSWNFDSQEVFWSPGCFNIFGRDPNTWIPTGENFRVDMPDEDREKLEEANLRGFESGTPFQLEYRYFRGGSRDDVRWIRVSCDFLVDASGTKHMAGIAQDITEGKLVVDQLRERTFQLGKAQEISKVGHWNLDAATMEVSGSDELFHIFGIGRDEATLDAFVDVVHPEDREYDVAHIQRGLETGQSWDIEHRILCRDGSIRHIRATGEATVNEEGSVESLFGTIQDITERKQAEQEIQRLNNDLERRVEERTADLRAAQEELLRQERMAALGKLTATVSHELRNPLGVIRVSAYVVRSGLNEEAPIIKRSLERIERSIVRCDRIIDELLDFTRIADLMLESTAIDSWLEETLNEQILSSGIALRLEFGMPDAAVLIDRDRFRRVIINVFDNGCQAMVGEGLEDTGSAEHSLTVRTQKHEGRVEVIFEDTGSGIAPDVYEKIFEPLYSTKGFGVGLGLPVVKQIMEQHGGGIEIESEEGRGTRVCLWLPHGHSTH